MKKIWIFLAAVLLVACVCPSLPALVPLGSQNQPTQTRAPTRTLVPEISTFMEEFTLVRLYPGGGDLEDQLQVESGKAQALGQHMFVEFDASW
jgi:hypothetical protein